MNLVEHVKRAGVIGAGGGGFPAPDGALGILASFKVSTQVQAAMAAGRQVIADAGALANAVIRSRPHPDAYREVV